MNQMNKIASRIRSSTPDLFGCGLLVVLFAATRFGLVLLGVKPDINHFYNHWQYLSLHLLKADYLQSIALLHSQPPLWNALLGALLNAAGGSDQGFLLAYSLFSWSISLSTAILIFFTLSRLKTTRVLALIASAVYIAASSAYYYEAYIFYSLWTAFLVIAFFSSLAFAFSSRGKVTRLLLCALSCLCLIALSLTWTLFHPIFVISTSWLILWRAFADEEPNQIGQKRFRRRFVLVVTGLMLSLATVIVPLKNKLLFNYFGSGSWMGLNLAQVAPGAPEKCGFDPLNIQEIDSSKHFIKFTESSNHPAIRELAKESGGLNYNHTGYIVRSNLCKSEASRLISDNFPLFLKARIRQFYNSHRVLSDSYFIWPKGLENGSPARRLVDIRNILYFPYPWKSTHRTHLAPLLIPVGLLAGAGLLIFSPSLRAALPSGAIESLVAGLWVMTWLYAVGHLFNGFEQERMRFTIEPLFIAWLSTIGYYCFLVIRRPRILNSESGHGLLR